MSLMEILDLDTFEIIYQNLRAWLFLYLKKIPKINEKNEFFYTLNSSLDAVL